MRKLIVLFLIISLFGCSSNEKKASKAIENYLSERLHDWKSYESVSIGVVDSTFQMEPEVWDYWTAKNNVDIYLKMAEEKQQLYDSYKGLYSDYFVTERKYLAEDIARYVDTIHHYRAIRDSFLVNFQPYFNGWQVDHSYRANNAMGGKTLGHYRFFFDKELSEVIDVKDLSE